MINPPSRSSTRIWFMSDLHVDENEIGGFVPRPPAGTDVCVVAGDVSNDIRFSVAWIERHLRPHCRVVFVPGNHEFYGRSHEEGRALARRLADRAGIVLLDDDQRNICGIRFLGATLWTDYELGLQGQSGVQRDVETAWNMMRCARSGPDHRRIDSFGTADALALNRASRLFLEERLGETVAEPTVVVTHHAPSAKGLGDRAKRPEDAGDASDLDGIVAASGAALWIHGHTHVGVRYRCGPTPVASNARGYGAESPRFRWSATTDVRIGA